MEARGKTSGPYPAGLATVISAISRGRNWRTKLALHEVFRFWDEVVGEEIGSRAQPEVIRGRILWVRVSDSMWMQHLHINKIMLLERLNRHLAGVALDDLRFLIDTSLGRPLPPKQPPPPPPAPPDPARVRQFDDLVSSLSDPDMRTTLKNLWLTFQK